VVDKGVKTMAKLFISHSWENKPVARKLIKDLGRSHEVWIDHVELHGGDPLLLEIQRGIENCDSLILLWSAPAKASRNVRMEWESALLLPKPLVPCRLDDTELELFLRRLLWIDFRESYDTGLSKLMNSIDQPAYPQHPSKEAPETKDDVRAFINRMSGRQTELLHYLDQDQVTEAQAIQSALDKEVEEALAREEEDPSIFALAGYHYKNAYMIENWDAIRTGEAPPSKLLEKAEGYFHQALAIEPNDPSAWNGIGNVLLFRRDLDAAEFFIKKAIEMEPRYAAAKRDLLLIERLRERRKERPPWKSPG
jgi:tetratricopeptide (TPR) repeat protein